ncbi:MAG: Lamin globular tail-like protein [Parcubacteria group bacterium]|nr:Lamin globular tail-like protein [Parcubacteria group bacterium]
MYDVSGTDTGREWVEIFNTGSSTLIITGSGNGSWRFVDNAGAHTLTLSSGNTSISAGGYFIITSDPALFLSDNPGFLGTIFKSSFTLSNIGATVSLKDGSGNTLDTYSYASSQGAGGDGNSLQRIESGWRVASPTPGNLNSTIPVNLEPETDENSNPKEEYSSAHYSYPSVTHLSTLPVFKIEAGRNRLATAGTPIEFKAESNIPTLNPGVYMWIFGDGTIGYGRQLSHSYQYSGDYNVVLNASSESGMAVSRTSVHVVMDNLSVISASRERIEIKNGSTDEVSLFGRALVVAGKSFVFPMDTIINARAALSFAHMITGLEPLSTEDVSLVVVGDTANKLSSQVTYPNVDLTELYKKAVEIVTLFLQLR